MMHNPTGFPDADIFDGRIPAKACQTLETDECTGVEATGTFAELLDERGVLSSRSDLQRRLLRLVVTDAATDESDLPDTFEIGIGTYLYSHQDAVALIGVVNVSERFRGVGYGKRLKNHIDNHAVQDGAEVGYTWLASEEGRMLADSTGYTPETVHFPDVDEIWSKELD